MKKPILAVMTLSLMTAACGPKTPELTSGIDKSNLDTTVSPVDDFYQYACGGWMKQHPLDAEHATFGAFHVVDENLQKQLRSLIDSLSTASNKAGSNADKIATLYNVGMDSVRLQKEGAEPIRPYLEEIAKLSTRQDLVTEMVKLHELTVCPFFQLFGEADPDNAKMNIAWVYQSGIGIGDRDYYLLPEHAAIREAYVKMIAAEFDVTGYAEMVGKKSDQLAKQVLALETRLAKAQYDKVLLRDPKKTLHVMTLADADKYAKTVDFAGYFKSMGLPELTSFNLCQPEFMQEVSNILSKENEEAVKAYYAWSLINDAASYLSDDIINPRFDFYGRTLSGVEQQRPRWKRVTSTVDNCMGEALGELYVAKYFPPEAKERMVTLVDNLKEAFAMRIKGAEWMESATKEKALDKLSSILVKVGYPDKWRNYSKLAIKQGDSYYANVLRASQFEQAYQISKINKPVDPTEWGMTPQTVNAYYNPTTNEICFPAAILQPPFFNMHADDAVNYGAIGVVIGHEMTHGFDDQGRQYDKEGNLHDWWQESDAANFTAHSRVLVDCFNKVKVLDNPELYANGELCLGENIADNGGLHISYQAMLNAIAKKQVNDQPMDGFTVAQRFFLAYAGVWANNIRPEAIRMYTLGDVHSLGRNRVNVTLPHISEFLQAWDIKPGDGMYLAPEERVVLW